MTTDTQLAFPVDATPADPHADARRHVVEAIALDAELHGGIVSPNRVRAHLAAMPEWDVPPSCVGSTYRALRLAGHLACQPSVTRSGAGGDGSRAIFLDPPYATSGDLYVHGDTTISAAVRDWCATEADPTMRIVLCGYDDEHDDLLAIGWTATAGRAGGGAGYSTRADNGRRERLWLSPACLDAHEQADLFGGDVA